MRNFRQTFSESGAFRMMLCVMLLVATILPAYAQSTRFIQTPTSVTFSAANGLQTNQVAVTITIKDRVGNPVPFVAMDFWWSDQASGQGITATASSGTSGPVTSGTLLYITAATPTVATSRISQKLVTDSNGTVAVNVIDSAKTLYFPVVLIENGERDILAVGAKLATANYK